MKRIGGLLLVVLIINIINVYSIDISSNLLVNSQGVDISKLNDGSYKILVNSENSKIAYKDFSGKDYFIDGLTKNSIINLDSNGKIIGGDFRTNKELKLVLFGNLITDIPENSIVSNKLNEFNVELSNNAKISSEPSLVIGTNNIGVVNYNIKNGEAYYSEIKLSDGTLSHDGNNFFIAKGNKINANLVSFSSGNENQLLFFNKDKIPNDLKLSYSVADFKSGVVSVVSNNKNTNVIDFKEGNPIIPINKNDNHFEIRSYEQGKISVYSKTTGEFEGSVYPIVQTKGKFVLTNGNLEFKYAPGKGLIKLINIIFGNYKSVGVEMFTYNNDGKSLLLDKNGNPLGLVIGGSGRINTKPVQQDNPGNSNDQIKPDIKNNNEVSSTNKDNEDNSWKNNQNEIKILGPDFIQGEQQKSDRVENKNEQIKTNDINQKPINPILNQEKEIKSNNDNIPEAKVNNFPFTKEEFLKDLYQAKTSFAIKLVTGQPNLGKLLETQYPDLYKKHFSTGSNTKIDEALIDYKSLLATEAKKYWTTPEELAKLLKKNQPALYDKYGKYLGFN